MLNGGDLDLNSVEMSAPSVKETVKHTMLSQEVVFRTQVHELHRLFRVQKNLLNDFEQRPFGTHGLFSWNHESVSVEPSRNQISYISTKRGMSSSSSVVDLGKDGTHNFFNNLQNELPEARHVPFDLQMPVDKCIETQVNKLSWDRKDHFSNFLNDSRKSDLAQEITCDQKETRHSLSLLNNIGRNGIGNKRKAHYIPHDVIDLESPNGCFLNNNYDLSFSFGSALPGAYSRGENREENVVEHERQSLPWFLQNAKNHGIIASGSPVEFESSSCRTQTHTTSEFFGREQPAASRKGLDIDLNIAQVDSFSNISTNSVVLNPSRTRSTSMTATSHHVNPQAYMEPTEKSNKFGQDDYSKFPLANGKNVERNCNDLNFAQLNDGGRVIDIDLERVPDSPSDVGEEIYCNGNASRKERKEFQLKVSDPDPCKQNLNPMDVAESVVEVGKKKTRGQFSEKLSGSLKSVITADNQYGTECGDSNFSSTNEGQKAHSGSQIENSFTEQDQRSSESTVSNNLLYTDKEERPEVDELVERAANSLVCLSSDTRAFSQTEFENVEATILLDDVDAKSQCPIDSYEEMVLNIEESAPENLTALLKKFEYSESGKECGYKLKRGTRMKDFQKDILPNLSALSRGEICEDINLMEGIIRSREYKKMRLNMGDGSDLCKPSRSRRSRVNYSRRYYG